MDCVTAWTLNHKNYTYGDTRMKWIHTVGLSLSWALALGACNNATSSDPATTERSALNPPTSLVSFTGDSKLTLRFAAANTEKEFQGYDIFIVAKTVNSVTSGKTYYPSSAQIDPAAGGIASIPRCKDNTAVFEAFGFPASTATCEGGSTGGGNNTTAGTSLQLADSATTTATEDPAPTNFAVCDENTTDKSVSLKLSKPILGPETCTISKTSDGKALVNGTTYSIFVATVAGDKKNKLSWTSNIIEDTPATSLYSATVSLTRGNIFKFKADNLKADPITVYDKTVTTSTATCTTLCKANSLNTSTVSTDDGIYIGRSGVDSYPGRAFLSVPTGGSIQILPRGPRLTLDATTSNANTTAPGVEGDQAIRTTTVYDGAGTLYPIYGYQVFDILVTKTVSGATVHHYGKIVIGALSVTGTAADASSKLAVPVTIIMQQQAERTDYFTDN